MDNTKKKKLHLTRIPGYGTSVLTKCGRNKNTGTFTNPNAKLCPQCVALSEEDGLTVKMTWKPNTVTDASGANIGGYDVGRWIVSATPPMLERQGNTIIDRNNPDAPPVLLDVNKVLALADISLDDYYDVHGPRQGQLTAG